MGLTIGILLIIIVLLLIWSFKKAGRGAKNLIPESKLAVAQKTHRTDFGNYEDTGTKFEDTKVETPLGTFVCHNNGTFTDITNRLMWIQAPWGMNWGGGSMFRGAPIKLVWSGATKLFGGGETIPSPTATLSKEGVAAYILGHDYKRGKCTVTFAGHSDWRLPTAKELLTIGDYPQELREKLFPNILELTESTNDFWSANDQTPDEAWAKHNLYGKFLSTGQK
jgi:hypothetical protein